MQIEWTTEGEGQFANSDQVSTTYLPSENETGVIVFYAEVNNGCAVKTVSAEVTIIEEIDVSFNVSPAKDLLTETQITFTPTNSNFDEYSWNFGDGNESDAVISSNEYSQGGTYTIELTVTHSGCEGTWSEDLEVLSKDELYVPNAFNPNAINAENQVVKVYGNNVDEFGFYFKIVNRWGKVMYETNSFTEANTVGWDGINNNNNEEQELNVFTYLLKGHFIEGESFERTGTVTQVK
jgi:PKD repeat protein